MEILFHQVCLITETVNNPNTNVLEDNCILKELFEMNRWVALKSRFLDWFLTTDTKFLIFWEFSPSLCFVSPPWIQHPHSCHLPCGNWHWNWENNWKLWITKYYVGVLKMVFQEFCKGIALHLVFTCQEGHCVHSTLNLDPGRGLSTWWAKHMRRVKLHSMYLYIR